MGEVNNMYMYCMGEVRVNSMYMHMYTWLHVKHGMEWNATDKNEHM